MRRDQRALEHRVGVGPEDRAVLERARLTLRSVDDDRGGSIGCEILDDCRPLPSRREPRTAATPQPGVIEQRHDRRRSELPGRSQAHAAPVGEVIVERDDGRFGEDTVNEGHVGLLPEPDHQQTSASPPVGSPR